MPLRKYVISVGLSLAAAGLALALGLLPFLETIELNTYDLRMRATARPSAPADDIVLVAINDDSVRRLAPLVGRWPWPRLVHASLVDFLARAPAKVIVYDILFTEPDIRKFMVGEQEWTGTESDQAFVDSVKKAGNVVLGVDAAAEGLVDRSKSIAIEMPQRADANYQAVARCVVSRPTLVPPFPALARAASGLGHTLIERDPDGPLRRYIPFVRVQDHLVAGLPVEGALLAQDVAGAVRAQSEICPPPLLAFAGPLLAYRGPTLSERGSATFNEYSFYDLFYSEEQILAGEKPQVDPSIFKDRIVVVSATASGTYDVFASPFGQAIGGGEIHANVIDALLRGRAIDKLDPGTAIALTLLAALLLGIAGAFAGGVWTLAAAAAAIAGTLVFASVRAFAGGLWIPLTMPLLAVALAFVGQLAWLYFVEGREKRQVKRLFSRYVPKDVYEQLIADPSRAALGGRRRTMTVLFSDVRGFTAMSEKASPEDVVGQLNEYFSRMVPVLFAHHGTLDKFVGDMIMGLFGAPLDDEDHAEHAVQAALTMSRTLDELNQEWQAAGKPALDIGIGISTGDMVAGNIGSQAIMSYTVIGDTVNLGARLESLNKEYGTRVIISEATRAALKGRYDIRPLGEVIVKGKSRPVAIFEVKSS